MTTTTSMPATMVASTINTTIEDAGERAGLTDPQHNRAVALLLGPRQY